MPIPVVVAAGLVAVLLHGAAPEKAPQCVNVGTRSEGWSVAGQPVRWAQCQKCRAVCRAVGTRSEGWYSSCDGTRIAWGSCSASLAPAPVTRPSRRSIRRLLLLDTSVPQGARIEA